MVNGRNEREVRILYVLNKGLSSCVCRSDAVRLLDVVWYKHKGALITLYIYPAQAMRVTHA